MLYPFLFLYLRKIYTNINNLILKKMNYLLDEIDKKILDFLVENTRTPFTEIAKQMNVSAGTIHVRVKKMEDAGIIKVLH